MIRLSIEGVAAGRVAVEIADSDETCNEVYSAIVGLLVACGYHPLTITKTLSEDLHVYESADGS